LQFEINVTEGKATIEEKKAMYGLGDNRKENS
jgi:hypothetical protein